MMMLASQAVACWKKGPRRGNYTKFYCYCHNANTFLCFARRRKLFHNDSSESEWEEMCMGSSEESHYFNDNKQLPVYS